MGAPVIWLEGVMGAGKSTLSTQLKEQLGLRLLEEPVADNPYLEVFYKDPKRWAFPMQMEMLHRRYAMQMLAAYEAVAGCGYTGALLDRGLPGDRVFAKLHYDAKNISELEWHTYERAFDILTTQLPAPNLLVFLDVSPEVALSRVKERARGVEVSVDISYITKLRTEYLKLIESIESGKHPWARNLEIMIVNWDESYQTIQPILDRILSLSSKNECPRYNTDTATQDAI